MWALENDGRCPKSGTQRGWSQLRQIWSDNTPHALATGRGGDYGSHFGPQTVCHPRWQFGLTSCIIFDTLSRVPENRKRLPARFYESANGRAPVRDWLLELGDDDRRTIGKDIAKAEFGWPIGMPS